MVEIEFIYNEISTSFQCNLKEKFKDILFKKLTSKIEINLESVSYLYSKKSIDNWELTLDDLLKDKDEEEKNEIAIEILDPINIDSFECKIVEELGEGENSNIYKVFNKEKNKFFAIKVMSIKNKKEKKESVNNILKEAKILSVFDSKNIVKYYNSKNENKKFYILMEYCDGKNLEQFIEGYKKNNENIEKKFIKEEVLFNIIKQLCSGIKEIHDKNIIHRDIKPSNIFINKENGIKIGDFGISKQLNSFKATTFTKKGAGTPNYIAPEIVKEGKYNKKADIYSLGCVLYELFTLSNYYTDKIYGDIKSIDKNKYDPNWQKLVDSMLTVDLNKRLDIDQVNDYIAKNIKLNFDNKNDIKINDTLEKNNKIKIKVKISNSKVFEHEYNCYDRIRIIKDWYIGNYFYGDMRLHFDGERLDLKKTFHDYNFKNGDTIYFVPHFTSCRSTKKYVKIYMEYKGKIREIGDFCLYCTRLIHLKEIILQKLKATKYINYKDMCILHFQGNLLCESDEIEIINTLGIQENSIINVSFHEELHEYIEKYSKQLHQLYVMGFDEEEIDIRILKGCLGDIPYYFKNIFEY